jgi:hypothetical protein
MTTYEDTRHAGIVHTFRHVNKERRAGLTSCGAHIEFRPENLGQDVPTCVRCIGYIPPLCDCSAISGIPISQWLPEDLLAGHDPQCSVVEGFECVEERLEDVVRECIRRGDHNQECDSDGFCQACGYQADDSNRAQDNFPRWPFP